MNVTCLYSENADVPANIRNNRALLTTVFSVVVGNLYTVYGQVIFNERLLYLLDPQDESRPSWYPAELFNIVDGNVPTSWQYRFFPNSFKGDLGAIWGYSELVQIPSHFADLAEREADALLIFARQKSFMTLQES